MDSVDISADITAIPDDRNARLLSESPLVGPSSRSNISSSVLSAHDDEPPTSDRSQNQVATDEHDNDKAQGNPPEEEEEGGGGGGDEDEDEEAQTRRARKAARMREEKLQNDLFLLKKLNGAFSLYTDALRATQSSTEVRRVFPLSDRGRV